MQCTINTSVCVYSSTSHPVTVDLSPDVAQNEVFHVGNSTDCYWLQW